MREIKFRGIREDNDDYWIHGSLIEDKYIVGNVIVWEEEYFNTEFWWRVLPETVGQFTGLKDKNETEVYEGDIAYFTVFDHSGNDTQYYGLIKFFRGCWVVWVNEDLVFELDWVLEQDDEIEIIGNIHDNPELLEKESN